MRIFLSCLLLILFTACHQMQPAVQAPKEKFDAMDSLTGTANWQLVDGTDTSYLYFSRLGDTFTNVYRFSIHKGDSVNTRIDTIVSRQDSVIWTRGDKKLLLTEVNALTARWEDMMNSKDAYILKKTDSLHMVFVLPANHEVAMQLTLPLSTFLVRKKYDYIHGSSYADSAIVKPRKANR